MELEALNIWPGWQAVRLIGEGSFGKVYEIVRSSFGIEEHSALKVISIPPSDAELQSLRKDGLDERSATEYFRGLLDEFVQEISLMSRLKGNAHIVAYEDYAVVKNPDWFGWKILIRMELLTDLPSYLQTHAPTQELVVRMAAELCTALEECSAAGVIHRDIKPDNIFVAKDGGFKLGDFGVARTIEKTSAALSKKGTYTYMAPEVYRGEAYGASVDVYSLGLVMFRLLNENREPFLPLPPEPVRYQDKNDALVRRIGGEAIPDPAHADAALSAVIRRACAADPQARYASAAQLKQALAALADGAEPSVQPAPVQAEQTATCSRCGSRNDGRSRFCTVCGGPLTLPAQAPSAVPASAPAGGQAEPPLDPRSQRFRAAGRWTGAGAAILFLLTAFLGLIDSSAPNALVGLGFFTQTCYSGLLALSVACARRSTTSVALLTLLDAGFELLLLLIDIFGYGLLQFVLLIQVLFCSITAVGAIVWLARPEKNPTGAVMCALWPGYNALWPLLAFLLGMVGNADASSVVCAVARAGLAIAIVLRALSADARRKQPRSAFPVLFLVPAVVLKLMNILFCFSALM